MMWQVKAVAAAVLLAALASGAFYVRHLQAKAARVDQAESNLAAYKAAVADRDKQAKQMQASIDETRAATTAAIATVTTAITDLRNHPPKASVIREQLPGEPCPSLRLDPGWVRDLNTASAAANSVPYPH